MKVHLHSKKVIECEDESFTETNNYTGEIIHILISLDDKKRYVVSDMNIEFFEYDLVDEDIVELATYGEGWDEEVIDPSYG